MFGNKLKELRTSHGLTQVQLARNLGVSKQCVSNWENDNILPSIDMLIHLAGYFGVSCDLLLERDNKVLLDVTDITPDQRAILQKLINEFKKTNQ